MPLNYFGTLMEIIEHFKGFFQNYVDLSGVWCFFLVMLYCLLIEKDSGNGRCSKGSCR